MSRMFAGFILPAVGKESFKDVLELKRRKVPVVLLCSHLKNVSSFDCDNITGGYLATKYLLDSGRERIAFIHGNKNWVDAEDRFRGYKKALREAGKQIVKEYVQYSDSHNFSDYEKTAVKRLLALKDPPDAIFAANDRMALATMAAVKKLGKNIPENIAIIGFDDIPTCENFSPSLSTVAQPIKDMAVAATEALIKIISSGKKRNYTRFFKPELIIRQSA